MVATAKSPLVAVDANVLLDLADDCAMVWDAIEILRRRLQGVRIVATASVLQEVAWLARKGSTAACRTAALGALRKFAREWKFEPTDFIPVGHGIVEQTALRIRRAGLIPSEEVHDSLIIAEAALAGCAILVSSDAHICQVDQTRLALVLDGCDVNKVLVTSPAMIVRKFFLK